MAATAPALPVWATGVWSAIWEEGVWASAGSAGPAPDLKASPPRLHIRVGL